MMMENLPMAILTGTMLKDNGKFGFIQQDNGEPDMFVLAERGGALPPIGSRVTYEVVTDMKTGKPRAERLISEGAAMQQAGFGGGGGGGGFASTNTGVLVKVLEMGKFGFIKQDNGQPDMFVLAPMGGALPPVGSKVAFDVVTDVKTGKLRAENLQASGGQCSGTLSQDRGQFGFIKQDSGEEDMFMLPPCPPVGTRLFYDVVMDEKTGRPRADNVQFQSPAPMTSSPQYFAPMQQQQQQYSQQAMMQQAYAPQGLSHMALQQQQPYARPQQSFGNKGSGRGAVYKHSDSLTKHSGTMIQDNGKFGFIKQDSGDEDMFVLSPQGMGGGSLPPQGARVLYDITRDQKTGRPRAENVQPEVPGGVAAYGQQAPFVQQQAYAQQGPFAQQTQNAPFAQQTQYPAQQAAPGMSIDPNLAAIMAGGQRSGSIAADNGKFGFIKQDCGEEDMFVLAPFGGGALPPVGTRVTYDVVPDAKTGRPRGENLQMDASQPAVAYPQGGYQAPQGVDGAPRSGYQGHKVNSFVAGQQSGTMAKDNGKFGFINQDGGGEDMFVLVPLGGAFPALGTRVVYDIVQDAKTGRPRAENLVAADTGMSFGGNFGAAPKGQGKSQSEPYSTGATQWR